MVWSSLLVLCGASQAVTVTPLNDTGQTLCYDSAGVTIGCASSGSDDGRYGRDAAASVGLLSKIGAGAAGFDFSKIANNGTVLPASATLGSNPTDWACTKDNVTGLIWEVKTTSGLRSNAHGYTWYSTDATSNGGNPGGLGTDTCDGTLSAYSNQCNTANYVAAVNAVGLCGATTWRMPTLKELTSITDYGNFNPAIDQAFFPNTTASLVWSATTYASYSGFALYLAPADGSHDRDGKFGFFKVRLVRAEP